MTTRENSLLLEHQAENIETSEEHVSIWQLPTLVQAAVGLFAVNLLIGFGMLATPSLEIDLLGHEVKSVSAAVAKPSPFAEVVDTRKRRVRVAAKLRPVVHEVTPADEEFSYSEAAASYQPSENAVRVEPAIFSKSVPSNGQGGSVGIHSLVMSIE